MLHCAEKNDSQLRGENFSSFNVFKMHGIEAVKFSRPVRNVTFQLVEIDQPVHQEELLAEVSSIHLRIKYRFIKRLEFSERKFFG